MTSARRRSLQGIRSMGDVASETRTPQKKFRKLAALAEEKQRRNDERLCALQRIEDVDERLAEIERHEAQLLSQLPDSSRPDVAQAGQRPLQRPVRGDRRGFILKY